MPSPELEKSPFNSKKFVAYLVAEVSWKIVLIGALLVFRPQLEAASAWAWWFMTCVVIVAGFIEAGYIGGQAWLDKYVRVASILGKGPKPSPDDDPTEKNIARRMAEAARGGDSDGDEAQGP